MPSTLANYKKTIYSQNGEEGIIEEINKRLGLSNEWFVDIGAWNGKHLSNTYFLLNKGWKGVDIEGDPQKYKDLEETRKKHEGKLFPILSQVACSGDNELTNLLSKTDLPHDFGILNIDIDSHDWWIWNNLSDQYSPKIVIIEINSTVPVGLTFVQPADKIVTPSGASFTSTLALGQKKGYQLVAHTGNNIFVRNDLVPKLNLPQSELDNPDNMFDDQYMVRKYVNKDTLMKASRMFIQDKADQIKSYLKK